MERPRENPVHYPADRRHHIWVSRRMLLLLGGVALAPVAAAWVQYLLVGLPESPPLPAPQPADSAGGPRGFPAWLRVTHYVNLLFMALLVRCGLQILSDHPRLYWSAHCTPGSEWARFTPTEVPRDRVWTAKDDARYLSPWIGLPGYRHTVGVARHWHFVAAVFWALNGAVFVALLFATDQWKRLVPTSLRILPEAWAVLVHYATLHLPAEPDGFYKYNPLQQLAYFAVVFLLAPLQILTGLAMSPAIDSRFKWYARLFGNRQAARSLHLLGLLAYLGFVAVHVTMVAATGLARNMNHIVLGTDATGPTGLALGLVGLAGVAAACVSAHRLSWRHPRAVQRASRLVVGSLTGWLLAPLRPRAQYTRADVSPHFWPNGKVPTSDAWRELAAGGFRAYRLRVTGLVSRPVELSLDDLRALGRSEQVTMHHCIQGWSGIAEWGGLPLTKLVELVGPKPEAKVAVFRSFGEGLYGGEYYDCHAVEDLLHPLSLLAYEMNGATLPELYGAPVRLRVENQLGYKQVKWVREIEFVASEKEVGKGYGGKNEDDEYFDLNANI
jgi:DMSO/TMAO reductase YedYZ molybdopterin-dependent catalytic subunit/thiosulfate reductase cytochrome b subunit